MSAEVSRLTELVREQERKKRLRETGVVADVSKELIQFPVLQPELLIQGAEFTQLALGTYPAGESAKEVCDRCCGWDPGERILRKLSPARNGAEEKE